MDRLETHHGRDAEHVTVVRAGQVVFRDVREMVQIVRVLTRAVDVADLVFAHQTAGHRVHKHHSAVRYHQHDLGQRPLGAAGHRVFEFLYRLLSGLGSPGFFHLGRPQILRANQKRVLGIFAVRVAGAQ